MIHPIKKESRKLDFQTQLAEAALMENLITIDMIDDWAGAAMQGLVTSQGLNKDLNIKKIADVAYEIATEMAKARGAFIEAYGDDLADVDDSVDPDDLN